MTFLLLASIIIVIVLVMTSALWAVSAGRKAPRRLENRHIAIRIACGAIGIVLGLVRRARLPPPLTNEPVHGAERDLVWPYARVVAEFDGDAFHWSPRAKRADNRRDGELALRGWQTVRLTWHEITEEPYVVVARLAAALAIGNTARPWVSGSTPPA